MKKKDTKKMEVISCYNEFDNAIKEMNVFNICNNCHDCCNHYFYISENEFLLILDYVMNNMRGKLSQFMDRAEDIYYTLKGKHPEIIAELDSVMATFDGIEILDFLMHEPINIVPDLPACPFLDKEKNECLIESVKPIACRLYGTVNKCINGKGIDIDACDYRLSKIGEVPLNLHEQRAHMARPYPLFYWLYYFVASERFIETLKLLEDFNNMDSESFFKMKVKNV